MGAFTMEMEKVNRNMQEMQERQKQIEKLERKKQQEKEQKQYEKDMKIALHNSLYEYFTERFDNFQPKDENDLKALELTLFRLDIRNQIVDKLSEGNSNDAIYLDSIYEQIFKKVYNKYKKSIEYGEITIKAQQDEQEQKEQQKKVAFDSIKKFFKWTFLAIFGLFIALIKMLVELAKDNK